MALAQWSDMISAVLLSGNTPHVYWGIKLESGRMMSNPRQNGQNGNASELQ